MTDDTPRFPANNRPTVNAKLADAADGAKTLAEFARRLDGKSQAEIAEAAQIRESRLNYIEFGSPPTDSEAARLGAVLRCPADMLIEKATPDNRGRLLTERF